MAEAEDCRLVVAAPAEREDERDDLPVLAVKPRHRGHAPVELPAWATRWRSAQPSDAGACVRVSERGVELSLWRDGQRLAAFLPADRYPTENAASYAVASGAVRFAPVSRVAPQVWSAVRKKAPSPHGEPGALDSDAAAE